MWIPYLERIDYLSISFYVSFKRLIPPSVSTTPLRSASARLQCARRCGGLWAEPSGPQFSRLRSAQLRSGNERNERWLINPNDTIGATIASLSVYLPYYTVLSNNQIVGSMRLAASIESRETWERGPNLRSILCTLHIVLFDPNKFISTSWLVPLVTGTVQCGH